ncbi:hypothetical protein [Alteribacillus bidgolensis]|uniref:hypothetical protein n=1 Tax=Alteribacillus bidgolensis TaxID=930129 RepID=UPI001B8001CC|nr:hypothetical protein [Alteribacillus bidgolensis]
MDHLFNQENSVEETIQEVIDLQLLGCSIQKCDVDTIVVGGDLAPALVMNRIMSLNGTVIVSGDGRRVSGLVLILKKITLFDLKFQSTLH